MAKEAEERSPVRSVSQVECSAKASKRTIPTLADTTNLEIGPKFQHNSGQKLGKRESSKPALPTTQVVSQKSKQNFDSVKSGSTMLENQKPESPRCISIQPQQ